MKLKIQPAVLLISIVFVSGCIFQDFSTQPEKVTPVILPGYLEKATSE